MKTKRYQLRISGLRENEGQIKSADLQRVLDALKNVRTGHSFTGHW